MTFCTAHRPAPQPTQQTADHPSHDTERRAYRSQPRRQATGQIFTDWASI